METALQGAQRRPQHRALLSAAISPAAHTGCGSLKHGNKAEGDQIPGHITGQDQHASGPTQTCAAPASDPAPSRDPAQEGHVEQGALARSASPQGPEEHPGTGNTSQKQAS